MTGYKAWHKVDGLYTYNYIEVFDLCEQHFGEAYAIVDYDLLKEVAIDNGGKWKLDLNGIIYFRNEKDIPWFLLVASHLSNQQNHWPYFTGPK